MARVWIGAVLAALWLTAAPVRADEAREAAWAALAGPGTVAILRHALAPGTGDPAGFRLDDCATQRNLDDRGRAQARALGAEFARRGIAADAVLSSQWCRCVETARLLGLGPVEEVPALNSFFGERAREPAQTAALRALLAARAGERLVIVTHQVNITALTGRVPASGEMLVLRPGPDGSVEVVGAIRTPA